MTFHFCPGESYWTTPRRGMLCLCPCWSPWEKTSWLMSTATISGLLSYQVGSCWACICVMYNSMWPCLVCSCQPEVQCFPPATTWRSWRQLRAENTTPRCFTPVRRLAFFRHLHVKKYGLHLSVVSDVNNVCCVSGDDVDPGFACSCNSHGEWHCHSGWLPACCQLRRCCGDGKVHLCHTRRQRWPVLLDACGGHWQGCTAEGKKLVEKRQQKWPI